MIKLANNKMLPQKNTQILKKMEKQRAKPPMCNDCYCAKVSRIPWRGKPSKDDLKKIGRKLKPGDVVSIDQLESSVPGLLGQMTGIPTTQRIPGSSVYVDHASDLSYIYHHISLTSEETVKGKEVLEDNARAHGVTIKHYHADIGRFKDTAFLKSIHDNHQTISFSVVGAHHQNGIAEKKLDICKGEQPNYFFMHNEDGLMQSTVTFGHMQSEQQMMEEIMLQPEIMMYAQYQDFVQLREYQPSNTNITLDVQFTFYNRKFRMVEKQGNGKIEQE
jgi:hypothetical protein